jgi:hypothetical protein
VDLHAGIVGKVGVDDVVYKVAADDFFHYLIPLFKGC